MANVGYTFKTYYVFNVQRIGRKNLQTLNKKVDPDVGNSKEFYLSQGREMFLP